MLKCDQIIQQNRVPIAQCQICCEEKILLSECPLDKTSWKTIQQRLDQTTRNLREDIAVLPPCSDRAHAVCARCFRRSLLGEDAYSQIYKRIKAKKVCMFCEHVSVCGIEKWLQFMLNSTQYSLYTERSRKINEAEWAYEKCPCWISIDVPIQERPDPLTQMMECPFETKVRHKTIQDRKIGGLLLQCSNGFCQGRWCYDCRRPIIPGLKVCFSCFEGQTNLTSPFLFGKSLTWQNVLGALKEILFEDCITCPRCQVKIRKTSQCNSISHCGLHICYVCRFTTTEPFIPLEHWDDHGRCGCPRWDTSPFWNQGGQCTYSCVLGECFDDERVCTLANHQSGIHSMNSLRQCWAVWALFRSLPHSFHQNLPNQTMWTHPSKMNLGALKDWFKPLEIS